MPATLRIRAFFLDIIQKKTRARSLLVMQAAKIISPQGGCCELQNH
jgi:hypothetical protein